MHEHSSRAAGVTAEPSALGADPVRELISAVRSINRAPRHEVRVAGDDEPCYWQRREWIQWVLELADAAECAIGAGSNEKLAGRS